MAKDGLPRSDFYVYVIFRPNGMPCYVGKGQKDRWKHHAKRTHSRRLAGIYAQAGGDLPVVKVREHLTEVQAIEAEVLLITVIGRGEAGPLVNLTDGGEGLSGYDPPEAHRAKIRLALLGRKRPLEVCAAVSFAAQNRSEEWRSKQRAGKLGKPLGEARCAALRAAWLRRNPGLAERVVKVKLNPEERSAKQSERNLGNQYGLGNKRTPEGQAAVTNSVIESNRRRNKTGKPTVHKGPQPWLDEGLSRSAWYRKRANARDGGGEANS